MDFSKYKSSFGRLVNRGQRMSNEIYQHLCENDNNSQPNIVTIPHQSSPIQPLISVPNTEISENTNMENTNVTTTNEEQNLKMRQEAHLLRDILPQNISEAVIYDLLQQYNTAETAINAYYEREITENQECG